LRVNPDLTGQATGRSLRFSARNVILFLYKYTDTCISAAQILGLPGPQFHKNQYMEVLGKNKPTDSSLTTGWC